jgi:hypothetical protein
MGWNKKSEIWQWVLLFGIPVIIAVAAIFLVVVMKLREDIISMPMKTQQQVDANVPASSQAEDANKS